MIRVMSALVAFCSVVGCSGRPTESSPDVKLAAVSADEFAGTWRSVTPSTEFVRLTVSPLSREQGTFGARLTFSGVYWEGSGRIDGDSLVTEMAMSGGPTPNGRLIARSRDGGLNVTLRPQSGTTTTFSFVREN